MSEHKTPVLNTVIGWVILILPLLLILFLFISPIIQNYALSLTDSNGLREARFVGEKNYRLLGEDDRFLSALGNTFFSPGLFLRIFLLVAAPLCLALLFMEMGAGLRLTLQTILAPLIVFTGAIILAFLYFTYFSPQEGLAMGLTGSDRSLLGDPDSAVGIVQNLLFANGLAYSLPLGVALYLGVMRGARLTKVDGRGLYGEFWSRLWRFLLVGAVAVTGFSLAGLEAGYALNTPLHAGETLFTYFFNMSFRFFRLGTGAAVIQYLIIPLLILGAGFMLVLELPRSRFSIRPVLRTGTRLTQGAAWGAGRILAVIAAGVMALIVLAVLAAIVFLPWLGSIVGLGGRGADVLPDMMGEFLSGMARSYMTALPAALICLVITAAAGYAFGYLRPVGGKAAFMITGSFIFMSPALFLIPYYLTFRTAGIIDTGLPLILTSIISPLGIVLFTLLFRGLRDEKIALEAGGGAINSTALAMRTVKFAALFSIPVFTLYLLASLNAVLMPITMLMKPDHFPVPLFLLQLQGQFGGMRGLGMRSGAGILSLFQYWLPLILLVVSIFAVFPRLALVVRKKGEAVPLPEPEVVEKLKG